MTVTLPASPPRPSLTLVVQGFAQAWSRANEDSTGRWPALERLVRRGTVSLLETLEPGWTAEALLLLTLLDLPADSLHASAPLEWLGLGGDARPGFWLKAGFVHLEVGSRSARLHRVVLSRAEQGQLVATLQQDLRFEGIEVLPAPRVREEPLCFLYSAAPLAAMCPEGDFAAMSELRDLLPQGTDGPLLRRLLTEVQMLLHEHPVNVQRAAGGARTANALWLTGLGEFAGWRPLSLPPIATNEPYLAGLCRLHGHEARSLPESAQAWLAGEWPELACLSLRKPQEAIAELRALDENWLQPLTAALRTKHLERLQLLLGAHRIAVDRRDLWRFWRRGAGLAALSS